MISEEKYKLLFENSKEAVFMTTPDGRYIDMNPAGVEMFGYSSREEMLGLDINSDIFADPDARKLYAKFGKNFRISEADKRLLPMMRFKINQPFF